MYASTPRASSTTFPRVTFPKATFLRVYNILSSFCNIATLMLLSYLAKTKVFTLRLQSSMFKKRLT
jgi:hypothetical protein